MMVRVGTAYAKVESADWGKLVWCGGRPKKVKVRMLFVELLSGDLW
jgi:hypothetical protein